MAWRRRCGRGVTARALSAWRRSSPAPCSTSVVNSYAPSTWGIRVFPDRVRQVLLKSALSGPPAPYGPDSLEELARHCTDQEDNANKVERQVRKSAAALLLEPRIGERFEGMVTAVSEKGTWGRIFPPPVEGKMVAGFEGFDVG